ncbi:MAG: carotenoid oxygenase family protein [Hellea sp.]
MDYLNRRAMLCRAAAIGGTAFLSPACISKVTVERNAEEQIGWPIGFKNVRRHSLESPRLERIYGRIPKGLSGQFYRNGPALRERGGEQVQHWFDGDGMVQRFDISENGISHIGRIVETEKYLADEAEGHFTTHGFGTVVEMPLPPANLNAANAANTNIVKVGNELLALWEGGSAHKVDLATLETLGIKSWAPGMPAMPFSAHPKVETNGTIWNFGQDAYGQSLFIYKISKSGGLENMQVIPDVPGGLMHDFSMTKSHLIFMLPSLRANRKSIDYLGGFSWLPSEAQRVVVLNKDDLSDRRDFELPPGLQFHFGNAYEERNGDIRFSFCTTAQEFLLTGLKVILEGTVPEPAAGKLTHAVLRRNGKAEITQQISAMGDHEFPQFNSSYSGQFARYLYTTGKNRPERPLQSAILCHDIETGEIESYDYGITSFAEEHLFVPRQNAQSENDGWLIGSVLDFSKQTTSINILNAQNLSDGPVAQYALSYSLPLGFHGTWIGNNS